MNKLAQPEFAALLEKSPNAYVVLDRDRTIVWMNAAYLSSTMRERTALVGVDIFEAFPSDPDSESFRLLDASLKKVVETGNPDEIALIRYDLVRPDGTFAELYWSATHTPLLDDAGRTQFILQHTVDVTELHGLRRLRDEAGLLQRADAVQAANRNLRDESNQLRNLFGQAPGFVAVVSGPDHVYQMANEAYMRLVAQRDIIGKSVSEALPELVEQGYVATLDAVRRDGKPYLGERELVSLKKDNSEENEDRYLDFIFQPVWNDDAVSGIIIQGNDVTAQVEALNAQRLLINELNHRVKNTLAIVQGLATQSFRAVADADSARASFDARLNALSAAHNLLTASKWEAASVEEIVRTAAAATTGNAIERLHFSGPDFSLDPQAALSLAMMVHELSTNAIKYGALADREGHIDVSWQVANLGDFTEFTFDWIEHGIRPIAPPSARSFGTRLIERGLSSGAGSTATLAFDPHGVHCHAVTRFRKPVN